MTLAPARLHPLDVLAVALFGMRSKPARVALSALGIAIGVATMLAVSGISTAGKNELMEQLDRLGTNLLVVKPNTDLLTGEPAPLAKDAVGRIARIDGVQAVAATGQLPLTVRRSEKVQATISGGITVSATSQNLPQTLHTRMRAGCWFNPATARYPTVVLGRVAADRLGIVDTGRQVWIGDRYYLVIGILEAVPLNPEIDRSALLGWEYSRSELAFDGRPTTVYERSADSRVQAVRDLIPASVDPEAPRNVQVSDPSAGLQAKAAAAGTLDRLLLGLGAVALFVGGVGVANTMVVSVLERRFEIGLRRSLGATRGQIRTQFIAESLLLSCLGGIAGVLIGAATTFAYGAVNALPAAVPVWSIGLGLGATIVIGVLAGIYPAMRAAGVSPTVALNAV